MNISRCWKNNIYLLVISLSIFNVPKLYADEFIIGVEEVNYYPIYDFSSTNTDKPSFTKDLLSAFFSQYQYSYRFVALPIKRFDQWYVERGIDFKFPDNFQWRNDVGNTLNITFSDPVLHLMAGVYVLKSRSVMKRDDVKSLGTILGFYPTLWLEKVKSGELRLHEESSPLSVIRHVLHGNVDATNLDGNVVHHNLAKLNRTGELIFNQSIKNIFYTLHLSSIKYPEVITQFNQFLKNNSLLVSEIKRKYQIIESFGSNERQ